MKSKRIGAHALLCEIRGDWKCLKEVFHLPAWNESQGLCFLCTATPRDLANVSSDASWRRQRHGPYGYAQRLLAQGRELSVIFSAPGMRVEEVVKLDWLHIMDLGVSPVLLGNLLWLVQSKIHGASTAKRPSPPSPPSFIWLECKAQRSFLLPSFIWVECLEQRSLISRGGRSSTDKTSAQTA